MSGEQHPSLGPPTQHKHTQSEIDRRDSGRSSAARPNMALLSPAPFQSSSLFDRSGRLELPPLTQSFGTSRLSVPAILSGDSLASEAPRKRKVEHTDWPQSSPALTMHRDESHTAPRPAENASVSGLRSSALSSESSTRDSSRSAGLSDRDSYRAEGLPSPYERSLANGPPKSPNGPDHLLQLAQMPYRPVNVPSPAAGPSASPAMPAMQSRHSFGEYDAIRRQHSNMFAYNHQARYAAPDHHRRSSPREGVETSVSPQESHRSITGPSIPLSTPGSADAYQMMTLHTSSGMMQVPVDVQAASRLADEKRKRNAGASARFRERRKRKEVEASAAIARLEMQVKQLAEDRDYLRHERDYFRNATIQMTGGESHFASPASPGGALRRTHQTQTASPAFGSSGSYDRPHERRVASPENHPLRDGRFSHTPEPSAVNRSATYSAHASVSPRLAGHPHDHTARYQDGRTALGESALALRRRQDQQQHHIGAGESSSNRGGLADLPPLWLSRGAPFDAREPLPAFGHTKPWAQGPRSLD